MIETLSILEHKAASVSALIKAHNILVQLKGIEDQMADLAEKGKDIPSFLQSAKVRYANELRFWMTKSKIHEKLASNLNKFVEGDVTYDDITD